VIPRVALDESPDPGVPNGATFWQPGEEELNSDEGFGYFRDVWLIYDVPRALAEEVIKEEGRLVALVASLARDPRDFDQIATALEGREAEELPDWIDGSEAYEILKPEVGRDEPSALMGLEVGVAGLAYALASAGMYPAASCRSHTEHSWSDRPVVVFAASRTRATIVSELMQGSGCGLGLDPARPELISVYAASIEELMALARRIMDSGQRLLQASD
jgi:hypothetical protein